MTLGVRRIGRRRDRHHVLVVAVAQNDRRPLERFKALYGGTINPKGRRRRCAHWQAGGPGAERCLRDLEPLLVVKREQARIALEFRGTLDVRRKPTPPEVWNERERLRLALAATRC